LSRSKRFSRPIQYEGGPLPGGINRISERNNVTTRMNKGAPGESENVTRGFRYLIKNGREAASIKDCHVVTLKSAGVAPGGIKGRRKHAVKNSAKARPASAQSHCVWRLKHYPPHLDRKETRKRDYLMNGTATRGCNFYASRATYGCHREPTGGASKRFRAQRIALPLGCEVLAPPPSFKPS